MRLFHYLLLSLFAAWVLGCADAKPQTPAAESLISETDRLNAWLAARWQEELDLSPLTKTALGLKQDYDKVDDYSDAASEAFMAWRRGTVTDLKGSIDYAKLSDAGKVSYDLWLFQLEQEELSHQWRQNAYIFDQMTGQHTTLPRMLINFHKVDSKADMEAYIRRIGGIARALGQMLDRAKANAAGGVRPPRFAYGFVIDESRALITGTPFEGEGEAPLWSDAIAKIDALLDAGKINESDADQLKQKTRAALLESFGPAYQALIARQQADVANTKETAEGVWSLPNGDAYYRSRVRSWTTLDLAPDTIHDIGLQEVARIRGEMEAIKNQVGYEGSLKEFLTFVRNNPDFKFSNDDAGREGYLQAARDFLGQINDKLPDYFGLLPKADLVVKRVEPFREQAGAPQHYMRGTPDGSRPGTYYVHLLDMNAMPKPELESIAYHEGNPGHHMQRSIAQELEGVPEFQTQIGFGAYTEGWALYAELLAKEMGGYQDPYSDLGRLGSEIWRAVRLVVDTGMHAKRWEQERAVQYFMDNSIASEGQIRSEIRRYLVLPGQALSYKIGMLKIIELRERAEAALGDKFDIRAFHDQVLGSGALPLPMLESKIDAWIAGHN